MKWARALGWLDFAEDIVGELSVCTGLYKCDKQALQGVYTSYLQRDRVMERWACEGFLGTRDTYWLEDRTPQTGNVTAQLPRNQQQKSNNTTSIVPTRQTAMIPGPEDMPANVRQDRKQDRDDAQAGCSFRTSPSTYVGSKRKYGGAQRLDFPQTGYSLQQWSNQQQQQQGQQYWNRATLRLKAKHRALKP